MAKKFFTSESLNTFIDEIKNYVENAISGKVDSSHNHDDLYYTKTEIDNMELITVADIDTICGSTIQVATVNEVTF